MRGDKSGERKKRGKEKRERCKEGDREDVKMKGEEAIDSRLL